MFFGVEIEIVEFVETFAQLHNFVLLSKPIQKFSAAFWSLLNFRNFGLVIQKQQIVERIDLASFGKKDVRLKVVAAYLGRRHKSDDFNSFLMHLFF